ncbi:hypothetical protein GCM10022247_35650 [Allokutzneria multivorans]|uniref:Uncharacterized protein n=1 Tax=Allokutzneria multivorans TaxID=1142134 RepID=A0ABP7SDS0_9PSEU
MAIPLPHNTITPPTDSTTDRDDCCPDARRFVRPRPAPRRKQARQRLATQLDRHLHEGWSIADLAAHINRTPAFVRRVFLEHGIEDARVCLYGDDFMVAATVTRLLHNGIPIGELVQLTGMSPRSLQPPVRMLAGAATVSWATRARIAQSYNDTTPLRAIVEAENLTYYTVRTVVLQECGRLRPRGRRRHTAARHR